MTIKIVNSLKYVGLFLLVFFTIISCEKEIESIGVNLVDTNVFSKDKIVSEVIVTNTNIDRIPANGLPQYLLGVYADAEFGELKASIVSQLTLPATGEDYTYGTNPAIDSVILSIPYQATRLSEDSEGEKPKFSIDSVIGDTDVAFQLNVYELKTFLNILDPNDPSKPAVYYSDKEFLKGDIPLFSGNFKINPDDTVSYIKRYMPNATVFDIDTIKQANLSPIIKLPLDELLIQQIFIDNASGSEFSSIDDFTHYFRGFFIEAEVLSNNNSHLISLDMTNAKMTIYYSNDENEEEDQDLNGNDINGEQGVRIKQQYDFLFGSIKSNVLKRDYTISRQSGEERLYLQGAEGSMATIELFSNENLPNLQENNWLITGANLIFYVDQNASSNIVPEQLFLYNYEENLQLLDAMTEGLLTMGGKLERDTDGNPYKYVFKITDYISELLLSEEPIDLITLGIKVFNPTDIPLSRDDTKIKDFSWTPKGVVLYRNDQSAEDKRIKLEIFYTEINN